MRSQLRSHGHEVIPSTVQVVKEKNHMQAVCIYRQGCILLTLPRLTGSQAFLPLTWDLSKLGGRNSNMLNQRLRNSSRPKDVTFHSWNQAPQRASMGIPWDLGTCVESLQRTTAWKLNGWNPRMVAKFL